LIGPAIEFGFSGVQTGTMPGKIFINYRREGTTDTAGRIYDRIAQAFGHKNLFVDCVGVDLKARLNNQVAMCQAFLTVIGPSWLDAKDEAGRRRIHSPDDFVAAEIVAALAHNIPVIPVLVDGARMPQVSELPDFLEPLARRQAVEMRRLYFDRDVEALIERVREAFGHARWRARTLADAAVAGVLILIGTGTYIFVQHNLGQGVQQADLKWEEKRTAAEAEANRKAEEAEKQRLATEQERQARAAAAAEAREAEIQRLAAEQERQARAVAEAEANRKAEEAEKQRLAMEEERQATATAEAEAKRGSEQAEQQPVAALGAEEEKRKRADAETRARYTASISQGNTDSNAGEYDKAITDYNEAIRLDPNSILAFIGGGDAYTNKGDYDRALADYNEAIRLDPKSALALSDRGVAYANKGDYDKALADHNEAIRLDSKSAHAFRNRGVVYAYKGDNDRAIADFNEAIRLDPKSALTFRNRRDAYTNKGDYGRALADYNEAIRLDPKNALALSD
jgi:tetratricopeptide (TPR) repeat protein